MPPTSASSVRCSAAENRVACFHCGTPCPPDAFQNAGKSFCCSGCLSVFEILSKSGLTDFYRLADNAGIRVSSSGGGEFAFMDVAAVREKLVRFSDVSLTKIVFRIPSIHCAACVWLLENLFRLREGIGECRVDFPRKELTVTFRTREARLSEVAELLRSLGYPPDFNLADLEPRRVPISRRLWLQLAIAGFAFGNIMLLSLSDYLGLELADELNFKNLFGWISLILCLPVVLFSAGDYWRAAWTALKTRSFNIEVPIAAGISALFLQSVVELLRGHGGGYFDSLAGLLFFLNCGKLFQQKTFERLAFDRDYKSFFPLAVIRLGASGEESVALSELRPGDRLRIRAGELIPADARLARGEGSLDYSFVTGEAERVTKREGDYLYAGGRQTGASIEVELAREVSQSYLASLWAGVSNHKKTERGFESLTNEYSRRFSKIVFAIAIVTAAFWVFTAPAIAARAFASVLIVACPCALALAAPFSLGSAQRLLAKRQVFLKNPRVLETMARVNSVVFDKTGTLTATGGVSACFSGSALDTNEKRWIVSLASHSTHPRAAAIETALNDATLRKPVRSFTEHAGRGIEGVVEGHEVLLGSAEWLRSKNILVPSELVQDGWNVHVAVNHIHRGSFMMSSSPRAGIAESIRKLALTKKVALLSGDNARDLERFRGIFPAGSELRFTQSPGDKLEFIESLRTSGDVVMMVGDGLNDAAALGCADVGVAVVEKISAFSPASDVIIASGAVTKLPEVIKFSRASIRVVRFGFFISSIYNVIGISVAASGKLSPVICAVLMPLSSISVVAFACVATRWCDHRFFEAKRAKTERHEARPKMAWEGAL
jgi:Cu+-exporting ATPase